MGTRDGNTSTDNSSASALLSVALRGVAYLNKQPPVSPRLVHDIMNPDEKIAHTNLAPFPTPQGIPRSLRYLQNMPKASNFHGRLSTLIDGQVFSNRRILCSDEALCNRTMDRRRKPSPHKRDCISSGRSPLGLLSSRIRTP